MRVITTNARESAWGIAVAAVLLALGCLSSCVITEARKGAEETPVVRTTRAKRMWQVFEGETMIGSVVLFESESDSFFSVRNEWQQDVGMIDATGRAWAFRPHNADAEWVGSGSIAVGASQILKAAGEVELREVAIAGQ